MSAVAVEHARQQWEEGHRRLQEHASEPARLVRLHAQVDSVTAELRRRVGQTFTLAELVQAYEEAERWLPEAVGQGASAGDLALVEDAAFHLYARGALDYAP
jgi:hypothetical protein